MTSSTDRATSPLLEHDPAPRALIEPSEQVRRRDVPDACVITFFSDVVDRLLQIRGARLLAENRWEDGSHPLLEIDHEGERLAVLHSGVGAPLAGGLLEQVVAMGCRAFVVCGGAGALRPDLTVDHLVVVSSSLRDEGTSHHYLPAQRYIDAHHGARTVLEQVLTESGVPFVSGRTWTTDAPYRETPSKISLRRAEGCLTVEMEAAALAAVARFRSVPLTQVVYCGDDLSGETWDHRSWQTRSDLRQNLFDLAASTAVRLAKSPLRESEVAEARSTSEGTGSDVLDEGPFFHGTKADLRVGDLLVAGRRSNYRPDVVMNHIYFTALRDGAGLAAELAAGEGAPRVYVVEPTGAFENDPNVTDKKFPGNPTRSYRSRQALRVIGEVDDWARLTPESLQEWRDRLAVMRAENRDEIIN